MDAYLDLIRHGQVEGGNVFRGSRDDPLSASGWVQMQAVRSGRSDWSAIFSSPARRCSAFAERLAAELGVPLQVLGALRERHFGDWEGMCATRIPPADLGAFWSDPLGFTPPGAEVYEDFQERVLSAWSALRASPGPASLVVTHGGVIRVLIADTLGMPPQNSLLIEVPYACLTRLRLPAPPGRPSLVCHG